MDNIVPDGVAQFACWDEMYTKIIHFSGSTTHLWGGKFKDIHIKAKYHIGEREYKNISSPDNPSGDAVEGSNACCVTHSDRR